MSENFSALLKQSGRSLGVSLSANEAPPTSMVISWVLPILGLMPEKFA